MKKRRLLIQNADFIITMNPQRQVLAHADMLIEKNRILQVACGIPINQEQDEPVDARGCIVIPGLINAHQHCAHTITRNLPNAFEGNLMETLRLFYRRLSFFDEQSTYAAALGALADLLRTGCTTSCDMHYVFPKGYPHMLDMELLAASQLGIRFHAMRGSLSAGATEGCLHVPEALVETTDSILQDSVRLIERYHDAQKGSMIQIGLAPCWLVYENQNTVREVQKLSHLYQIPLHSHLADSRDEFAFCKEKHGCTPIQYAEKMGCLQEGNFFAHCAQLTKQDFAKLAINKVGVVCCPNSDMILNSAIAKVSECFRRGIPVGIGVDGAASDNASNMMAELKNAYLIQKFSETETPGITPEKALYMATAGGAKVLGRQDIGHLAPGMMADFVMLNWNQLQYAGGKYDPVYALVLSGDARMVDRVFVNGKQVVQGGKLCRFEEESLCDFINAETRKVIRRMEKATHSVL